MSSEIFYLVKFDRGYYAAKQPHYDWSFTNDPMLALKYKTKKKANERGEWGIEKITDPLQSYVLEKYNVNMEFEGVEK